jgi:cytochrome oxidase assembly protein ShyY1
MVLVALPVLVGFGVWQLQRAAWKADLLAELAANAEAPLLDLADMPIPPDAQFRTVRLMLTCDPGTSAPRAGRNVRGQSGYSHIARCRTAAEPMLLDIGWSARPEPIALAGDAGPVTGVLVRAGAGGWLLVDRTAAAPLVPSAPPGLDTISNNHLSYAIQWFSFAAILAVIYGLWLRRWLAQPHPRA